MSYVVIYNNGGHEILGKVTLKHAMTMLARDVARVRTSTGENFGPFLRPTSLELQRYIYSRWIYQRTGQAPYSKDALKLRDRGVCAYCGCRANTVDHVVPRCQGGTTNWLNVVLACEPCNAFKAGRTPEEAGMTLRRPPYAPTFKDIFHPRGALIAGRAGQEGPRRPATAKRR
ncbi:HNH endonuclease [Micrococcales bacterium 31B]|nr:HNH endonuclease [Micrococcales bacterium 31B]